MTKRAYKYRFYPTLEQVRNLARTFGCTRFVYNYALHTRKRSYFDHDVKLYAKDLSAALTALKKEEGMGWLKDVSSVCLQQALRHLDTAFTNFFEGRAKYPVFKKKHGHQSATYTDNAFTYRDECLTLAKQNTPLDIVWSRPLPEGAKPSSVTVSKDTTGRYFISILVEETIAPLPPITNEVGIDLGIKSLAVTSDGDCIANPKHWYQYEKQLARAQRRSARKKKGSKNREKARRRVARIHARIADTRRDVQHKLTTRLIRENQTIVLESLSVKNMVKNHRLAKAISDAGWGEIARQLEYKAKWYGRTVVRIDRWQPSSKTCFDCGYVLDSLPLDVREWTCPQCGVWHDRDVNASLNILAVGRTVSACGGAVRHALAKVARARAIEAGTSSRE
jgi:putative transposase